MLIVVGAHGGREARDVVAPSGEDISDERIGAVWKRSCGVIRAVPEAKIHHSGIDIILLDLIAEGAERMHLPDVPYESLILSSGTG